VIRPIAELVSPAQNVPLGDENPLILQALAMKGENVLWDKLDIDGNFGLVTARNTSRRRGPSSGTEPTFTQADAREYRMWVFATKCADSLLQFAEQVTPIRDKMNEAFHRDAYKRLLG
jgi:hypothetical protein